MNRKKPFFILLVLALAAPAVAAGFDRTDWGESESVIRGRENSRIVDESSPEEGIKALFVNDRVAGLDAWAIYLLSRDRLVQTRILFAQEHLKPEQFLAEYARVEESLRRQHGQPLESGEHRRNGSMPEGSDLGRMVAVGEVTLLSRWETEDTVITHVLRGESLDVDHEINYVSKKIGKTESRVMEQIRPPRRVSF